MKNNPLSMSASASAIIPSTKNDRARSRSTSVRNGGEYENGNDEMYVWMMPAGCSSPRSGKFGDGFESGKLEEHLDLYEEEDVDIDIPALPSEIGRKDSAEALVVPRRLAGESMVSESNSDDESTSSSSVQL